MKTSAIHGESGYERRENDAYYTESWVTLALCRNWPLVNPVWEPAAGKGHMADTLRDAGYAVADTDIEQGQDFFGYSPEKHHAHSIVTNPPYAHAEEFIRHALSFDPFVVAMLLRNEFDSAASRRDLFYPPFACKLVLTKRPRWDWWETDKPKASPRHNFAWFIWDLRHSGEPVIRWAP